ncbi:hypothetical protein C8F04DRAFT_1010426 [Mycena alexandri]|uniref:Uncharacterized protein n=1 Tax=Mycena alexandri TaxID=1745969 RepID=A0AAD6SCL9_9AGAR|nr:hypothetical protein C8F04DRAFT_1010426 [Mycena alexandri]
MVPSYFKSFIKHSDATPPRTQAVETGGTPEATKRDREMEADRGHKGAHLALEEPQRIDLSMQQIAAGRPGGEGPDVPRSLLEQPPVEVHPIPRSEQHFIPANVGSMSHSLGSQEVEVSTSPEVQNTRRTKREGTNGKGAQSHDRKFVERLEKENSDLKKDAEKMRSEIFQLGAQNQECNARLAAAHDRETRRAAEQFEAQGPTFGVTANMTSTADVRRTMENLEAEIFQVAAALSDLDLRSSPVKNHALGGRSDHELYDRMVQVLGEELARLLSGTGAHAPEMLVQIALQTAISNWGFIHLRSWVLERQHDGTNAFLAQLYAGVRHSEVANDALRWRAMTCKQLLQRMYPPDLKASLLQRLADVVNLTLEEPLDQREIEGEFRDRIEAAVRLLFDLKRDIGTNIVSDDLEVVFVDPGEIFEPKAMENMWPEEGVLRGSETVVCTTSLGLQKRGDDGGHPVTLVKPKVLVRSTLGSLMTEEGV